MNSKYSSYIFYSVLISAGWLFQIYTTLGEIPAFPGAEGFGSKTCGGRGGKVIEVTSLESDGEGTLREACRSKGKRIVVFRVSGAIRLNDVINIPNPYITVAGQSAPCDGICLIGAGIVISTHDVIIRNIRVRVGDALLGPAPGDRDCITFANETPGTVYNNIVDHCSVSWAVDEDISTWYTCNDITFQWCIISETLYDSIHPKGKHSRGLLVGDHSKNISIHHCLFVNNARRNPLLKGDTNSEVINNVMYNWKFECIHLSDVDDSGPIIANIIGNYCKTGPETKSDKPVKIYYDSVKEGTKIYLSENYLVKNKPENPFNLRIKIPSILQKLTESIPFFSYPHETLTYLTTSPAMPLSGITSNAPKTIYKTILENAGAVKPIRDTVDNRIVNYFYQEGGKIIDSQNQVGAWPVYRECWSETDTDHDGLPDSWESNHNLNPADASDSNLLAPNGYTYIEEYSNNLMN